MIGRDGICIDGSDILERLESWIAPSVIAPAESIWAKRGVAQTCAEFRQHCAACPHCTRWRAWLVNELTHLRELLDFSS